MVTGNITWVCCGPFSTSNTLGFQQQSEGFSIKHIRVQSSNMGMSWDILHGWQEDFTTICFHPVEGLNYSQYSARNCWTTVVGLPKLKDRITPHVTNFFRLRLTIEKQEGKRKYKSDGAVMVGEFVCMYVCSCTVSE